MSDERGGRYYREARFFLAGDRSRAQMHTSEARMLMGEMRDSLVMGGPPVQIRYTQLQDGTTIKAVMSNGQYQAQIISPPPIPPVEEPAGGIRYAQVIVDVQPVDPYDSAQIGKPFTLGGYPHGVVSGPHPQILFGGDIPEYEDYDTFSDKYLLAGADVLTPTSTPDELAIGRCFWTDEFASSSKLRFLTWGAPVGLTASTQEGVYCAGHTVALPCTSGQRVVGAAIIRTGVIAVPKLLAVITTESGGSSTSQRIRVKSAPLVEAWPPTTLVAGDFTEAFNVVYDMTGYPSGSPSTAYFDKFVFSNDGLLAAGVLSNNGVCTIEITVDGLGGLSGSSTGHTIYGAYSQTDTLYPGVIGDVSTTVQSIVKDAAFKDGVLQYLWYTQTHVVNYTGPTNSKTETYDVVCKVNNDVVGTSSRAKTFVEAYEYNNFNDYTGFPCETFSRYTADTTNTYTVTTMPLVWNLEQGFSLSSTVSGSDSNHSVGTNVSDDSCNTVSSTSSNTGNGSATYSLVAHTFGSTPKTLATYTGSGDGYLSVSTIPEGTNSGEGSWGVVVDSKNFVFMRAVIGGFSALPVGPFTAPVSFLPDGGVEALTLGVLCNNGKLTSIPFLGEFFSNATTVRFAPVNVNNDIGIG